MSLIGDLAKGCIDGIQLMENKRSDPRKLHQLKLSFSLEQTMALAKLAYQIEPSGENRSSSAICFIVLKCCTKNFQTVLCNSNLQVHAHLSVVNSCLLISWNSNLSTSVNLNENRFKPLDCKCSKPHYKGARTQKTRLSSYSSVESL